MARALGLDMTGRPSDAAPYIAPARHAMKFTQGKHSTLLRMRCLMSRGTSRMLRSLTKNCPPLSLGRSDLYSISAPRRRPSRRTPSARPKCLISRYASPRSHRNRLSLDSSAAPADPGVPRREPLSRNEFPRRSLGNRVCNISSCIVFVFVVNGAGVFGRYMFCDHPNLKQHAVAPIARVPALMFVVHPIEVGMVDRSIEASLFHACVVSWGPATWG